MTMKLKLLGVAGVALACILAGAVVAEESEKSPPAAGESSGADTSAGAPASDTSATTGGDTAASAPAASGDASASGDAAGSSDSAADAAPAAPIKPRPAELMPKAAHSLMLGLVDTGEHLIAVGDRGEILASNDGKNWAQVEVPVRSPLTAVSFVDANNGWAVGHDAAIVHTADGGKTWQLQNFQPELQKPFLGVLFLDPNHGFAVGAYGLFDETTDGGKTWSEVKADPIRGDELHIYSISKLGNGNLLVAGEQGLLGISTDTGKTWKKLPQAYEGTLFGSMAVGDKGALLCGLRGHAYLTQDAAGGKWQQIETNTTASLFGCGPAGESQAIMVGLNGLVMLVDTGSGKASVRNGGLDGALSAGVALKSKDGAATEASLVVAGEFGVVPVPVVAAQ
ncbi:MAG: hypothetical protein JWR16_2035 [Nevskia sp.]|nr:hypothetical protein [Nevskia sp.]